MKDYKVEDITDITGFEKFLRSKGFEMYATNTHLNTYNSCGRVWSKGDKSITLGLMDSPTRVGIKHLFIVDLTQEVNGTYSKDMIEKDWTYLPDEDQYEEYYNRLTR